MRIPLGPNDLVSYGAKHNENVMSNPPVLWDIGNVDDHALHGRPGVVAGTASGHAIVRARNHDASGVGIQENLGGIEAHPAQGIERALDPNACQ